MSNNRPPQERLTELQKERQLRQEKTLLQIGDVYSALKAARNLSSKAPASAATTPTPTPEQEKQANESFTRAQALILNLGSEIAAQKKELTALNTSAVITRQSKSWLEKFDNLDKVERELNALKKKSVAGQTLPPQLLTEILDEAEKIKVAFDNVNSQIDTFISDVNKALAEAPAPKEPATAADLARVRLALTTTKETAITLEKALTTQLENTKELADAFKALEKAALEIKPLIATSEVRKEIIQQELAVTAINYKLSDALNKLHRTNNNLAAAQIDDAMMESTEMTITKSVETLTSINSTIENAAQELQKYHPKAMQEQLTALSEELKTKAATEKAAEDASAKKATAEAAAKKLADDAVAAKKAAADTGPSIDGLKSKLVTTRDALNEQLQRVRSLETGFHALRVESEGLKKKVNPSSDEAKALSTLVTGITFELVMIPTNITSLRQSSQEISEEIDKLNGKTSVTPALALSVDAVLKNVSATTNMVLASEKTIKPKMEDMGNELAALSEKITKAEAQAELTKSIAKAELAARATDLKGRFDTLNKKFESTKKYIESIETKALTGEQKQTISALKAQQLPTPPDMRHIDERTAYFANVLNSPTNPELDSVRTKQEFDNLNERLDKYDNDLIQIYQSLATIESALATVAPPRPGAFTFRSISFFFASIALIFSVIALMSIPLICCLIASNFFPATSAFGRSFSADISLNKIPYSAFLVWRAISAFDISATNSSFCFVIL